jgi:cytochrome c peroxidase
MSLTGYGYSFWFFYSLDILGRRLLLILRKEVGMKNIKFLMSSLVALSSLLIITVGTGNANGLMPVEELGKAIFFDTNLSINRNEACAVCHGPMVGWTGPLAGINAHGAVYEGSIMGRFGNRKPPSAAYATLSPILNVDKKGLFTGGNFWDGRATGERLGNPAADQAQGPFLNPKEQALPDSACVVYRVCTATGYPVSFETVFGSAACDITWPANVETVCATEGGIVGLSASDRNTSDVAYDNIGLAIAAYEASSEVNAFTSKYDYSLMGKAKLSKKERRGFALFEGKANCKACHPSSGRKPLFTDFTYDNLGIPKNPENPVYNEDPNFIDLGLGGFLETRPDYASYSLENYGRVKVATLRNVDMRPSSAFVKAYGHNGYFKSLRGIVHFYNTRDVKPVCPGDYTEAQALAAKCWPAPEVEETVNRAELGDLGLTPAEEDALVAFLETLTDGFLP